MNEPHVVQFDRSADDPGEALHLYLYSFFHSILFPTCLNDRVHVLPPPEEKVFQYHGDLISVKAIPHQKIVSFPLAIVSAPYKRSTLFVGCPSAVRHGYSASW